MHSGFPNRPREMTPLRRSNAEMCATVKQSTCAPGYPPIKYRCISYPFRMPCSSSPRAPSAK